MAKMTLGKISNPSFTAAMKTMIGLKLPIQTSYKFKTLTNKFNEELKKFGELRKEIIERHCKKKEDGTPDLDDVGNYKFDGDMANVTKEMNDLLAIEIDFDQIKVSDLGSIELEAEILLNLGDVISV